MELGAAPIQAIIACRWRHVDAPCQGPNIPRIPGGDIESLSLYVLISIPIERGVPNSQDEPQMTKTVRMSLTRTFTLNVFVDFEPRLIFEIIQWWTVTAERWFSLCGIECR